MIKTRFIFFIIHMKVFMKFKLWLYLNMNSTLGTGNVNRSRRVAKILSMKSDHLTFNLSQIITIFFILSNLYWVEFYRPIAIGSGKNRLVFYLIRKPLGIKYPWGYLLFQPNIQLPIQSLVNCQHLSYLFHVSNMVNPPATFLVSSFS